jgi:uncharacterized repeat protein (TIGR01451 family)
LALSGSLAGPVPLTYKPYQNFSDGIIPQSGSVPFMWHDQGMVAAVANAGPSGGRSLFWNLPFETLPERERKAAMDGVMGWLSDLGDSTFTVDARRAPAGEPRTFTLTLRNLPQAQTISIAISNTLPLGMSLVPGSLDQSIRISPASRTLSWQGTLAPGEEHQIRYQGVVDRSIPAGTRLDNRITISNLRDQSSFQRVVPLWIDTADLSRSSLSSQITADLPERTVTYTLALRNSALVAAEVVTAVLHLPDSLHVLTGTLRTSGGEATLLEQQVIWNGALEAGFGVTTTVVLTQSALSQAWLPAVAFIEDGLTDPVIIQELRYSPPEQSFLPIFAAP